MQLLHALLQCCCGLGRLVFVKFGERVLSVCHCVVEFLGERVGHFVGRGGGGAEVDSADMVEEGGAGRVGEGSSSSDSSDSCKWSISSSSELVSTSAQTTLLFFEEVDGCDAMRPGARAARGGGWRGKERRERQRDACDSRSLARGREGRRKDLGGRPLISRRSAGRCEEQPRAASLCWCCWLVQVASVG